jgi:hypothetical protein
MRFVSGFLVLFLLAAAARADDNLLLPRVAFSATAVNQTGRFRETQTIHYADGKLRIDGPKGFATTILDLTTETECVLMANRTYLVLPLDGELFRRFIARQPDVHGDEKLATQVADNSTTSKYAFGDDGALNAAGYYWVTGNGIMVRREWEDGVLGQSVRHVSYLRNIVIAPQPATLFAIPAGYRPAR